MTTRAANCVSPVRYVAKAGTAEGGAYTAAALVHHMADGEHHSRAGHGAGRKVIDLRLNIREPVDLCGIPVPDLETGTTRWLVPDELPRGDVLISSRKR